MLEPVSKPANGLVGRGMSVVCNLRLGLGFLKSNNLVVVLEDDRNP